MSVLDWLLGVVSPRHRETLRKRRAARAELDSLVARGLVEKVWMFPAPLGGIDDPRNVTYLPPNLLPQKRDFEAELARRVRGGEDLLYHVTPEYDNDSFVPARLHLKATTDDGRTVLEDVIDVVPHRTWLPTPTPTPTQTPTP